MAVFKCKMCGGDLDVTDPRSVIQCDYCGTSQTIPVPNDDKKVNLFNRANKLRLKNDFDKAEGIYEGIVSEFPEEAEAYWGICLCKYGIEYVDDPATGDKIPTCHRTSFKSIFDEENYILALKHSDDEAKSVYGQEAAAIDRLQKDILQVVNTVEPYDVFICYKETGADGERTHDSVMAQDIYEELTAKGLKVFFARITLEDKLGTAYEPYIFAALNSAKVLLSIGTKPEHFEAVWVKNEWSRYLDFMKTDRKRTLIPCYKDMDPYDMPDEFSNLQAQNMGKIGAMQDLIRGVLKIVQPAPVQQQTVIMNNGTPIEPLVKRTYMFLEDRNWDSAEEYTEKILDLDPECADAYLCKLLAELHCTCTIALSYINHPFEENVNFQKALRYGNDEFVSELRNILANRQKYEHIQRRNIIAKMHNIVTERLEFECMKIYENAVHFMNNKTDKDLYNAKELFEKIPFYKDSVEKLNECEQEVINLCEEKYQSALRYVGRLDMSSLQNAIAIFEEISFYKDSAQILKECRINAEQLGNAYPKYLKKYPLAEGKQAITDRKNDAEKQLMANPKPNMIPIYVIFGLATAILAIPFVVSCFPAVRTMDPAPFLILFTICILGGLIALVIISPIYKRMQDKNKAYKQMRDNYNKCLSEYNKVKDIPEFNYMDYMD